MFKRINSFLQLTYYHKDITEEIWIKPWKKEIFYKWVWGIFVRIRFVGLMSSLDCSPVKAAPSSVFDVLLALFYPGFPSFPKSVWNFNPLVEKNYLCDKLFFLHLNICYLDFSSKYRWKLWVPTVSKYPVKYIYIFYTVRPIKRWNMKTTLC